MAKVIVIAVVFTVAIIGIFSYRRYITSMQINRNPCTHVASYINTCITKRKPALKNHACIQLEGPVLKCCYKSPFLCFTNVAKLSALLKRFLGV